MNEDLIKAILSDLKDEEDLVVGKIDAYKTEGHDPRWLQDCLLGIRSAKKIVLANYFAFEALRQQEKGEEDETL